MGYKVMVVFSLVGIGLAACGLSPQSPTPMIASMTSTPFSTSEPPTPTVTIVNIPIPTHPALPVVSASSLTHVDFLDPNNGWGVVSNDGGLILRTVDGGKTWLNATPPGLTGIGYSTNLSILDVETVWALIPNADFFTGTLYRTTNGGVTWTSFEVPFGGGSLQFLDASSGRVLADRGAAAGSQSVEMFQSSDGGATWLSVYNNDPTRPDSSNSLPFGGNKNGMTFIDANTGWVTGSRPMGGDVYLFVTHDGGISWEQQTIPLPTAYQAYQFNPQPPLFFSNDGILSLRIYRTNSVDFTFYTSHTGGASWTGDPTNANQVIKPGNFAFADALHGWSWDGGPQIYFTTDGTHSWKELSPNLDLSGQLSQLVFVPGSVGQFIGWALTSEDNNGHAQLYKTIDNGGTWTLLNP